MRRSAETTTDPESGELLEKILIELPEDHWSGKGGERVWAKPLGDDRYEVRNTPWYAYDVNWGDVVSCEGVSEADLPVVVKIASPGGHCTLRVFFDESTDGPTRSSVLKKINERGATYENADDWLYALDLEPDVDPKPVLDFLAVQEERGILSWETGWS